MKNASPEECTPNETREALLDVVNSLWEQGLSSADIAAEIGSLAFEAEVERARIGAKEEFDLRKD